MSFWLGVFAALAVWNFINVVSALALYGRTRKLGWADVALSFTLMITFMAASWYIATF